MNCGTRQRTTFEYVALRHHENGIFLVEMAVPAHWVSQPNDPNGREKKVHLVTLSPGMPEYILVEKNFQASMKVSTIVSIERVQNPALNGIYETRKAKMDEGPKGSNEMRLFHGTARENLDKINTYGFNRNYAGAHGQYVSHYAIATSLRFLDLFPRTVTWF